MIHYHGTPITPETVAVKILKGRHAFISFSDYRNINLAAQHCQSFALDNGAFTFWKQGIQPNWEAYYAWVLKWMHHPRFDFAIIPDVIGAGEEQNDELLSQWPESLKHIGCPVWHMDESEERLYKLATNYPRVAIGSCAEFDVSSPNKCVAKLEEALQWIITAEGYPVTKLHGLRMLNPKIFTKIPLSSADSTNIARNIGIDSAWKGTYQPKSRETRAAILAERIESENSSCRLQLQPETQQKVAQRLWRMWEQ